MPDGPGSGLAVTALAPQPERGRGVGHRRHRLGAQARVADHAALAEPVLADLELRLHQSARSPSSRVTPISGAAAPAAAR